MSALVSIVIPTYNRRKVVSRSIDSCLNQTYSNIEIIICDDHSTDGTIEYIQDKYSNAGNLVCCSTPNGKKGANVARNMGAKKAKGKFVAFLDSDDYLMCDSIEIRVHAIEKTEYALVYGDVFFQMGSRGARHLTRYDDISEFDQRKYLMEELSLCITSSIMVRKCVLENVAYLDEDLKSWQDDDLVISVGMRYKMRHCLKPVATIVTSRNSISRNWGNIYRGCRGVVNKHKKEIIKYSSIRRYFLWKIRVFSLWAKWKEEEAKNLRKKQIYGYFYYVIAKMIQSSFRHIFVVESGS